MSQPRLTVVTVNHNQATYLEQTLCSVLDQGYDNLEYLVVDLSSQDSSPTILRHYENEVTWWSAAPERGVAAAINEAIGRAMGTFISILPSGGLYLPGALDAVARMIEANASDAPDWLVGHCLHLGGRDEELGQYKAQAPRSLAGYLMHQDGFLPLAGTFYRKSLFAQRGLFSEELRYAYDHEMNARLLAAGCAPTIVPMTVASQHDELPGRQTIETILASGREHVAVAKRHDDQLPLSQRYAVWRSCDERQRIYTLAESEADQTTAQRVLWQRLLRRPWWLASRSYRQTLLQGHRTPVSHSPRHAA